MSASGNNGNQAAALLLSELVVYCQSELLSENGLREKIQRHGYNHVSDFRFFHFACHNERVNEGIIQYLLEYFPISPLLILMRMDVYRSTVHASTRM
mmetsp:Transcript_27655/g.42704  ORF Transcript_27655/g.42704 Transcript_27655/m.42704 type:complete len:97 (+) Transcript_27655:53-343(+)